jgi:homeobox protein cut-like
MLTYHTHDTYAVVHKIIMDKSVQEMREFKTASISGRKRLNELTKSFRAKEKEREADGVSSGEGVNEMLKGYQEEIDQLSKRSKFSETAFLGIFKSIYEVQDPIQCIESLMETVMKGSTTQLEIERLKGELGQYDEEFRQLKNQDITIRRLEDQLAEYREQNEDKIAEEIKKKAEQIEQKAAYKLSEMKEVQLSVEKQMAMTVQAMKHAQDSADRAQTQLYEVSSQGEQKITALMAENALLADGTQRLSMAISRLESELAGAQKQLKHSLSSSMLNAESAGLDKDLQDATAGGTSSSVTTLQLVVAELQERVLSQEDLLRSEKQRMDAMLRESTQHVNRERESLARVKQELAERPTREDMTALKKQLKMLQKIAFNVEDEEHDDMDAGTNPESHHRRSPEKGPPSLEQLLASRMKTLERELTEARRDLQETRDHEATVRESAMTLKKSLDASNALVSRLETDLEGKSSVSASRTVKNKNAIEFLSLKMDL